MWIKTESIGIGNKHGIRWSRPYKVTRGPVVLSGAVYCYIYDDDGVETLCRMTPRKGYASWRVVKAPSFLERLNWWIEDLKFKILWSKR